MVYPETVEVKSSLLRECVCVRVCGCVCVLPSQNSDFILQVAVNKVFFLQTLQSV